MAPQKNITPPNIALLSPDIDDSSNLSKSTTSVTPERITSKKRHYQILGKSLNLILGKHIMIGGNLNHVLTSLINNIEDLI